MQFKLDLKNIDFMAGLFKSLMYIIYISRVLEKQISKSHLMTKSLSKTVAHSHTEKEKKYGIESPLFEKLEMQFDVWNRCWKDKQGTVSTQKGQKL